MSTQGYMYVCTDCNTIQEIKNKPIKCKQCNCRIFRTQRTNTPVRFTTN